MIKTCPYEVLAHYFPEREGQPIEVGDVVKHTGFPDTSIGLVVSKAPDPNAGMKQALEAITRKMAKDARLTFTGEDPDEEDLTEWLVCEVEWSAWPETGGFSGFMPPMVRRVAPRLIANQIVNVQPMSLPSGLIFYHDYMHDKTVEKIELDVKIGDDKCEEISRSTSGTALEKSGWASKIRTTFIRAWTGASSSVRKIARSLANLIRFSR